MQSLGGPVGCGFVAEIASCRSRSSGPQGCRFGGNDGQGTAIVSAGCTLVQVHVSAVYLGTSSYVIVGGIVEVRRPVERRLECRVRSRGGSLRLGGEEQEDAMTRRMQWFARGQAWFGPQTRSPEFIRGSCTTICGGY
jgi:hypothetical protein